ncbi:MAG: phosphoenolpyruvate carboxylase, partial [Gammaproteobacteria bacterium]|nr:phosphoenolpyruvate carboxylase [Gammaproteobacteria bacterium]
MQGDKELRSRVKLLGTILGEVLKEQNRETIFDVVEDLRQGYIDLRKEEQPEKRTRLNEQIEQLDSKCLKQVIRAFSSYFNLANIADELQQHKSRRREASQNEVLWEGSFDTTLSEFKQLNISADELQTLLNELTYMPVFTAHPTEA